MASSKDKRQNRMGERTSETARDRDQGFESTTLQLPDEMKFIELAKNKNLNIVPYVVSINNHPDKKNGYPDKGDPWWRKPILTHKNIGVDNDTYICPRTIGKKCPICEEASLLSQEYTKNETIITAIRAKKRDVICVQDADDPKAGIQIFDVSYHLFTKLLLKEVDNGKDEYRNFAEPEGGFTLSCRFEQGNYKGRKFWKIDRIDFEPREDYSARLLKQTVSLDDILIVLKYDELKNIFMQMEDEGTGNSQEEQRGEKQGEERSSSHSSEEPEKPVKELEGEDLIGTTIIYTEDGEECEITEYDNKNDLYSIKDNKGDVFEEIPRDAFTLKQEEEASSTTLRPSSRGGSKKTDENPCPYDHEWGADCGKQDQCSKECPESTWDKCNAEFERLNKK